MTPSVRRDARSKALTPTTGARRDTRVDPPPTGAPPLSADTPHKEVCDARLFGAAMSLAAASQRAPLPQHAWFDPPQPPSARGGDESDQAPNDKKFALQQPVIAVRRDPSNLALLGYPSACSPGETRGRGCTRD